MQIGAENRNQMIALLVLVVVAALMLPRFFSGHSAAATPSGAGAAGLPAKKPTTAARAGKKAPPRKPWLITSSLDPSLRFDLLKQSDQPYEGGKRNIFDSHPVVEIPKPDPNFIKKQQEQQQAAQVAPPPPPIPLKFYGFATQQGQAKRVFLSSGDDVFVGTEGQVINRRYRIVKVNNASVDIEDILNNNKQTIPLTPAG